MFSTDISSLSGLNASIACYFLYRSYGYASWGDAPSCGVADLQSAGEMWCLSWGDAPSFGVAGFQPALHDD